LTPIEIVEKELLGYEEAEYFDADNPQELLEKVRYFTTNEQELQVIAEAGRERCMGSGYSHPDQVKYMIEQMHQ